MTAQNKPESKRRRLVRSFAIAAGSVVAGCMALSMIGAMNKEKDFFEITAVTPVPFATTALLGTFNLLNSPRYLRTAHAMASVMKNHHDIEADYLLRKLRREIDEKQKDLPEPDLHDVPVGLAYSLINNPSVDDENRAKFLKFFPHAPGSPESP